MSFFFSIRAIFAATALLASDGASPAEPVDDLIRKGDAFDQKFQPVEALKFYLSAEKLQPSNVRILVRIARQYRHLMQDATGREEKLKLGAIGLDYARRAAALGPDDSEAQLSVAISYAKMLPIEGTKAQVDASPRIKAAVDKALKLDPRNDIAWHVLGRWHRVLAGIGGIKRALAGAIYGTLPTGSNETAVKCLEKAIALNPARLMHYIELGRIYAQMGRGDEARRFLIKGLAMPNTEKDDPETKLRGLEVLEKLR
jgi:tetratricopeptide (TPR) repeat protein